MIRIYPYYRISDKPASIAVKRRPHYVNKEICLKNFIANFGRENLHVIGDSVGEKTEDFLRRLSEQKAFTFEVAHFGSSARSLGRALDLALQHPDDDIVYFVEDDFLHRPGSKDLMIEAFRETDADYVTLYDHPDKYVDRDAGGPNPFIKGGGEETKVLLSTSSHWKITNSTVMTFAARVKTLREDERIWRKFSSGRGTRSFRAFCRLCKKVRFSDFFRRPRILISPIPGWSAHGESGCLSPLVDWQQVAEGERESPPHPRSAYWPEDAD
jgi:glycosyltransferase involved in cell wall biosynthesis